MNKTALRQEIRRRIRQLSEAERASESAQICRRVTDSSGWCEASCVLLYYPMADEVDVRPLLTAALQDGKRVLFPVVQGDDLQLVAYSGETRRGAFGIEEPIGEPFADLSKIDLVVVPGRAFDRQGHRLGRGRGYYDRLLPQLSAHRLAVCFPCQIVDNLPYEPHDAQMDEVVY